MRSMMANLNASTSTESSESSGQNATRMADSNMNMLPPSVSHQRQSASDVAILWDIENCPVPKGVLPEYVVGNIRMALQGHPLIKGAVKMFSAYGDFCAFPRRLREGCQRTGVRLIDVPNGRKDAADKAILVDMFVFALDNPPPSSIMLISGDVDFAPALHTLGQRGYTVILVIPSGVGVSSALYSAGKFVWEWPSVAHGEFRVLNDLKDQLVRLLGHSRGCLPLYRVQAEYQKFFGRPLYLAKYEESSLENLLGKMSDTFFVEGKGQKKFVYQRKFGGWP